MAGDAHSFPQEAIAVLTDLLWGQDMPDEDWQALGDPYRSIAGALADLVPSDRHAGFYRAASVYFDPRGTIALKQALVNPRAATDGLVDDDDELDQLVRDDDELPDWPEDEDADGDEIQGGDDPTAFPWDEEHVPTFPVGALAPWQSEFVSGLATEVQVPIDLVAMEMLATVATTAAGCWEIQIKDRWREPLNLYTSCVLRSGERKTPVMVAVTAPVRIFEKQIRERERPGFSTAKARHDITQKRLERLKAAAAKADTEDERREHMAEADRITRELDSTKPPALPQLLADDCTLEKLAMRLDEQNGRIAILSDEAGILGILAGRYSGGVPVLELVLQAHDGTSYVVDRVGRESLRLEHPLLTMGLMMQPHILKILARQPAFRGQGLLPRFLYAVPQSLVGTRKGDPPAMSEQVADNYEAMLANLLEASWSAPLGTGGEPTLLRLTPEAYQHLVAFRDDLEDRMGPGGDLASMADWTGKLPGAVARIAGLLHLSDHAALPDSCPTDVAVDALDRAVRIGRYLIPHAKLALDMAGGDPDAADDDEDMRKIDDLLLREGARSVSARDLEQYQNLRAGEAKAMLARLEGSGKLRQLPPAEHKTGRPPGPRYALAEVQD